MKLTQKHPKITLLTACTLLAVSSGIVSFELNTHGTEGTTDATHAAAPCDSNCTADTATTQSDSVVARRMQERLKADGQPVPSLIIIENALRMKARYLTEKVSVEVHDSSDLSIAPVTWTIDFSKHPELLTLKATWSSASFVIDRNMLSDYLTTGLFGDAQKQTSIVLKKTMVDAKGVTRAVDTPIARSGYDYDIEKVADTIERAMYNGSEQASLDLSYGTGSVTVTIDGKTRQLSLLSSGRSNYTGSPEERVWNVHKAINERVNNIVVPAGAVFSFVDSLDAPVTVQKGWKEGLGLFGGGAAFTPGAGICQAATTTYRAALLAGLPIVEKRSHSMFVDHYEPYGVGLDATVFPGFHDMRFKNDTSDVILIQAYIDEATQDVTVNMYGIPDGRSVSLEGPYFNNTPNRAKEIRPLGYDEIAWVDTVTYADGKTVTKPIVSTYYKGFFKSVKTKYAGLPGVKLLSTLVPDPAKPVAAATQSGQTVVAVH